MEKQQEQRIAWLTLGTLVGPFLFILAYVVFTRWPWEIYSVASDCLAFIASILVGIICITKLPFKRNSA